jgi:hypothetical protein
LRINSSLLTMWSVWEHIYNATFPGRWCATEHNCHTLDTRKLVHEHRNDWVARHLKERYVGGIEIGACAMPVSIRNAHVMYLDKFNTSTKITCGYKKDKNVVSLVDDAQYLSTILSNSQYDGFTRSTCRVVEGRQKNGTCIRNGSRHVRPELEHGGALPLGNTTVTYYQRVLDTHIKQPFRRRSNHRNLYASSPSLEMAHTDTLGIGNSACEDQSVFDAPSYVYK